MPPWSEKPVHTMKPCTGLRKKVIGSQKIGIVMHGNKAGLPQGRMNSQPVMGIVAKNAKTVSGAAGISIIAVPSFRSADASQK